MINERLKMDFNVLIEFVFMVQVGGRLSRDDDDVSASAAAVVVDVNDVVECGAQLGRRWRCHVHRSVGRPHRRRRSCRQSDRPASRFRQFGQGKFFLNFHHSLAKGLIFINFY